MNNIVATILLTIFGSFAIFIIYTFITILIHTCKM